MRQTKDYSKFTDAEKFYTAINDCKDYFGESKFYDLIESMRDEKPTLEVFNRMVVFLAGIEGYPVLAMYQYAFGFEAVKPPTSPPTPSPSPSLTPDHS